MNDNSYSSQHVEGAKGVMWTASAPEFATNRLRVLGVDEFPLF